MLAVARQLDRALPPDITIAGSPTYYLGMPNRRGFVSTESFLARPVETWRVPPPSVVILTRGADESIPVIQDFLQQRDFVKVYCFPITYYGGQSIVYQSRSIPVDNTLPKCSNS
jgi:hypothetical protein